MNLCNEELLLSDIHRKYDFGIYPVGAITLQRPIVVFRNYRLVLLSIYLFFSKKEKIGEGVIILLLWKTVNLNA